MIASNMKQLGLGLLQYTQDYDENFPPANGWHDAVYPYVQNESMFNFAGIPVVYHAPANPIAEIYDLASGYCSCYSRYTLCAHRAICGWAREGV